MSNLPNTYKPLSFHHPQIALWLCVSKCKRVDSTAQGIPVRLLGAYIHNIVFLTCLLVQVNEKQWQNSQMRVSKSFHPEMFRAINS